ncbi:MAG: sugar O-acetyltransferase [Hespellia sp.]|nr:sugar O-acetyltransferase [Hespellia sp.]
MTEYEKSQAGLPHIFDTPMVEMYNQAAILSDEYNRLSLSDVERQQELLGRLLKSKGSNVRIMPQFHCEFGSNITIGNNVFINFNSILMDNSEIVIGNNVRIGPNVSIYTVNHAVDPDERAEGICINQSVHICDKVWFGGDVKVLPGVTIGEGSIIGAGSVVTKSIPAGVIAVGNPCRVIRRITEQDKLNIEE